MASVNMSGIYEIVNLVNGKRYVGSAVHLRKRWAEHRRDLRRNRHHCVALQRAWKKYGEMNFVFAVIEICQAICLIAKEQKAFDRLLPEYNTCKVAGSALGLSPSLETRAKLSATLSQRMFSAEHRAKISAAIRLRNETYTHSPTTLAKMRAASTGRKFSDEARAKMRISRQGRRPALGSKWSKEQRQAQSERLKAHPTFVGKQHSDETRIKISAARKILLANPVARDRLKSALSRPEVKAKKSARMTGNKLWLGRRHSDETKAALRAMFLGREVTEETRRRMADAQRRKEPPSLETKAKMTAAHSGLRNAAAVKIVYTIENSQGHRLTGIPMVLRERSGISSTGMTQLIKSRQKTANGWTLVASL